MYECVEDGPRAEGGADRTDLNSAARILQGAVRSVQRMAGESVFRGDGRQPFRRPVENPGLEGFVGSGRDENAQDQHDPSE
jgi:hypothetical protein